MKIVKDLARELGWKVSLIDSEKSNEITLEFLNVNNVPMDLVIKHVNFNASSNFIKNNPGSKEAFNGARYSTSTSIIGSSSLANPHEKIILKITLTEARKDLLENVTLGLWIYRAGTSILGSFEFTEADF